MAGRATLTAEIMNGPMNEVRVATKSADRSRAGASPGGDCVGVAVMGSGVAHYEKKSLREPLSEAERRTQRLERRLNGELFFAKGCKPPNEVVHDYQD
jgi:hypothetical protein